MPPKRGRFCPTRLRRKWETFDSSLPFIYGDQPTQRFAVRVLDTKRLSFILHPGVPVWLVLASSIS